MTRVNEIEKAKILTAKGVNGTITFDGSILTITRKGLGNKGQKDVPARSIGGVQIRPATLLANGFIQFSVAGEGTRSSGGAGRLQHAANDENSVIFTKKNRHPTSRRCGTRCSRSFSKSRARGDRLGETAANV